MTFKWAAAAAVTVALGCFVMPQPASAQPSEPSDISEAVVPPSESAQPSEPSDASESVELPSEPANPSGWPSKEVIQMTDWVVASGDNGGLPFIVIDKTAADIFVFDAQSQFVGTTPALIGSAPGDESDPGIGDRELSAIAPDKRTTPAGRFVASFGPAEGYRQVLWVDFETAVSMHPVVTTNKKEHRLQRLKSPTAEDNRITYGCINVSADFYANVVGPLFKDTQGIVYILPETKPVTEVFLAYRAPGQ